MFELSLFAFQYRGMQTRVEICVAIPEQDITLNEVTKRYGCCEYSDMVQLNGDIRYKLVNMKRSPPARRGDIELEEAVPIRISIPTIEPAPGINVWTLQIQSDGRVDMLKECDPLVRQLVTTLFRMKPCLPIRVAAQGMSTIGIPQPYHTIREDTKISEVYALFPDWDMTQTHMLVNPHHLQVTTYLNGLKADKRAKLESRIPELKTGHYYLAIVLAAKTAKANAKANTDGTLKDEQDEPKLIASILFTSIGPTNGYYGRKHVADSSIASLLDSLFEELPLGFKNGNLSVGMSQVVVVGEQIIPTQQLLSQGMDGGFRTRPYMPERIRPGESPPAAQVLSGGLSGYRHSVPNSTYTEYTLVKEEIEVGTLVKEEIEVGRRVVHPDGRFAEYLFRYPATIHIGDVTKTSHKRRKISQDDSGRGTSDGGSGSGTSDGGSGSGTGAGTGLPTDSSSTGGGASGGSTNCDGSSLSVLAQAAQHGQNIRSDGNLSMEAFTYQDHGCNLGEEHTSGEQATTSDGSSPINIDELFSGADVDELKDLSNWSNFPS